MVKNYRQSSYRPNSHPPSKEPKLTFHFPGSANYEVYVLALAICSLPLPQCHITFLAFTNSRRELSAAPASPRSRLRTEGRRARCVNAVLSDAGSSLKYFQDSIRGCINFFVRCLTSLQSNSKSIIQRIFLQLEKE